MGQFSAGKTGQFSAGIFTIHEYTHIVTFKINGNRRYDQFDSEGEGTAMDEGLSDYFAAMNINSGTLTPTISWGTGTQRRSPRYLSLTGRQWDEFNNKYVNGEVIGGACYDLGEYIGKEYTEGIVFDALFARPESFEDIGYYIAVEDDNDGNISNGCPHHSQINQAFNTNHGIDFDVPAPPTPVVTISGPTYLAWKQQGTFTASATSGTSPYSYNWWIMRDGQSTWSNLYGGTTKYITGARDDGFTLKVIVTDAFDNTDEDTHYVDGGFFDPRVAGFDAKLKPEEFALGQNYPNPFNPTTTIKYDLKESGFVKLNIYNVKGQVVKKLVNKAQSAGRYESTFDASSLPSGLYYYSLEAGSFKEVKKMILMK